MKKSSNFDVIEYTHKTPNFTHKTQPKQDITNRRTNNTNIYTQWPQHTTKLNQDNTLQTYWQTTHTYAHKHTYTHAPVCVWYTIIHVGNDVLLQYFVLIFNCLDNLF